MATYIPEKDRDHRYDVFHVIYPCKIPYIHTRSIEDIRRFGMPSSGFREFDTGQENTLEDRYLTINEMLTHWKNGVNVRCKYDDTVKIYEAITKYLNYWLAHIRTTFSTNHVPVEDLQDLDAFANVVYDKAKYQFTSDIVESALMGEMKKVSVVDFDTILAPQKPKAVVIVNGKVEDLQHAPKEDPYPKREGMLDMFNEVRTKRFKRIG